jgi:hypothetical protein
VGRSASLSLSHMSEQSAGRGREKCVVMIVVTPILVRAATELPAVSTGRHYRSLAALMGDYQAHTRECEVQSYTRRIPYSYVSAQWCSTCVTGTVYGRYHASLGRTAATSSYL